LFADQVPAIALKDLNTFDYIWLITWLHLNKNWNPTVQLPRGPRIRHGTLATRAPHRPNPIGLSATRLLKVEGLWLDIEGIDLLDQTPVLDIKPYVAYCDAFPQARCGYIHDLEIGSEHEPDVFGKSVTITLPESEVKKSERILIMDSDDPRPHT
jgi:tRNA-Thr(GGU) m(6)t(6)A37 methyltransferase TsaA